MSKTELVIASPISKADLGILSAAVSHLEHPSLAGKLAAIVGMPVEKLLGLAAGRDSIADRWPGRRSAVQGAQRGDENARQ